MTAMHKVSIGNKLNRFYAAGVAALIFFYLVVFNLSQISTENDNSARRLAVVSPYYFSQFGETEETVIEVNPLLTLYRSYDRLPAFVQIRLDENWRGTQNFYFENGEEYIVFAAAAREGSGDTYYAIENVALFENEERGYSTELGIFVVGVLIISAIFGLVVRAGNQLARPFIAFAEELNTPTGKTFGELSTKDERTYETELIANALDQYRARIDEAIRREQSFTRYVSHELRTPMTVIRGAVSILRKRNGDHVEKQCDRISDATANMEKLMQTFLNLARRREEGNEQVIVSAEYLDSVISEIQHAVTRESIEFTCQQLGDVKLEADALLLSVVVQNLVLNAVNCTEEGRVNLFVDDEKLQVIDSGVGLGEKARGYEGFGVGLKLVEDICQRYGWRFELSENITSGCTATVYFDRSA